MKEIYLICQKAIATDTPEYSQNPETYPMFAVKSKKRALKEIEWFKKDEKLRQEEFKRKYNFPIPMKFDYEYQIINLFEE